MGDQVMTEAASIRWRSPEELVEIGFARSRLVMVNEAHNGWLRCVRNRRIGTRVLPMAHVGALRRRRRRGGGRKRRSVDAPRAAYRGPGKRERTELQKDVRFIRVVVNGPNDVYVERKRPHIER